MLSPTFPIPTWLFTRDDLSNDQKWLYCWIRYLCKDGHTRQLSTQKIADMTGFEIAQLRDGLPRLAYVEIIKARRMVINKQELWSISIPPEMR